MHQSVKMPSRLSLAITIGSAQKVYGSVVQQDDLAILAKAREASSVHDQLRCNSEIWFQTAGREIPQTHNKLPLVTIVLIIRVARYLILSSPC